MKTSASDSSSSERTTASHGARDVVRVPRRIAARVGALWLAFTTLAAAQPAPQPTAVDDVTRNAARDLAHRASEAYARGDYETAQDLFHRSHALVAAPTLSLRQGQALEKLGRLVEAAEAYVRTLRTPLDEGSPAVFVEAVELAERELAALRPRIPKLKVVVSGAKDARQVQVQLDRKPLPTALIGVEMPVNPGSHELVAEAPGDRVGSARVAIGERETRVVVLELGRSGERNHLASAAAGPDGGAAAPHRSWAIVAFGVGGLGLGLGVGAGVIAVERHADAERRCPDARCIPGSRGADDVDAFRTWRTVSTVGYALAVVGAGSGAALLLTGRSRSEPLQAGLEPFVGLGQVGVTGRF